MILKHVQRLFSIAFDNLIGQLLKIDIRLDRKKNEIFRMALNL